MRQSKEPEHPRGCLAHSQLRAAMIPTPCQQGVEEQEASTALPYGSWMRLRKRVSALEMARCPFCQHGALWIIAAITQGEVISKVLRHLKRSADPPLIAPARARQETFDWVASIHGVARDLRSDVREWKHVSHL